MDASSMDAADAATVDASELEPDSGVGDLDAAVDGGPDEAGVDGGRIDGAVDGGDTEYGECDFSGIWAVREVTRSTLLAAGQFTSRWHYLELEQTGDTIEVTEHFECGEETHGTVTETLDADTTKARMAHNLQVGRKGKVEEKADACSLQMDRFWAVWGASEATFVPAPRNSAVTLASVKASTPLPTREQTAGAEDWDADGEHGVAVQVSGSFIGTRHIVERGWTEWLTNDEYTIDPSRDWPDDLMIRVTFDLEQTVLAPSTGLPTYLRLRDPSAVHHATLRFLGRTAEDARAKVVLKDEPFDTCLAIQGALPAVSSL